MKYRIIEVTTIDSVYYRVQSRHGIFSGWCHETKYDWSNRVMLETSNFKSINDAQEFIDEKVKEEEEEVKRNKAYKERVVCSHGQS